MSFRLFGHWLTYVAVRVFICVAQALRIESCQAVAHGLAIFAADIVRLRHKVVDENLRHAFPDWSPKRRRQVARDMWEHLFLLVCEIAHAPRKIHRTNWRQYIRVKNPEGQIRCMLDRRPAIVVSGHFGNFEIGGYMAGLLGFPSFMIARPLDNPFLERYVKQFRESHGQLMLPKQGIAGQVAYLLERGQKLLLLGDQFGGPKGCWIDFLGRPASYHKAIALFSLTSGAPMVITYTRRLDRPLHFEMGVLGVFDPASPDAGQGGVRELTQWYNDRLEEMVRAAPEQYWWVHRRWKNPPQKKKHTRQAA